MLLSRFIVPAVELMATPTFGDERTSKQGRERKRGETRAGKAQGSQNVRAHGVDVVERHTQMCMRQLLAFGEHAHSSGVLEIRRKRKSRKEACDCTDIHVFLVQQHLRACQNNIGQFLSALVATPTECIGFNILTCEYKESDVKLTAIGRRSN